MSMFITIAAISLNDATAKIVSRTIAGISKDDFAELKPNGEVFVGKNLDDMVYLGKYVVNEDGLLAPSLEESRNVQAALSKMTVTFNKEHKTTALIGFASKEYLTARLKGDTLKANVGQAMAASTDNPSVKAAIAANVLPIEGDELDSQQLLDAAKGASTEPTALEAKITQVALSELEPSKQWLQHQAKLSGYNGKLESVNEWLGTEFTRWDALLNAITEAKQNLPTGVGTVTSANSEVF